MHEDEEEKEEEVQEGIPGQIGLMDLISKLTDTVNRVFIKKTNTVTVCRTQLQFVVERVQFVIAYLQFDVAHFSLEVCSV